MVVKTFEDQLREEGIATTTVDPASRAGGNHPHNGSKWKTYYRSCRLPQWGVLIAHADAEEALPTLANRLDQEAVNYRLLASAGYDTPASGAHAIKLFDHFNNQPAAALVIEHIDGPGPFKARTEARRLMRAASHLDATACRAAEAAWDRLRAALASRAPIDLQVMLSKSGRIVIIDPEKTTATAGYQLIDWINYSRS